MELVEKDYGVVVAVQDLLSLAIYGLESCDPNVVLIAHNMIKKVAKNRSQQSVLQKVLIPKLVSKLEATGNIPMSQGIALDFLQILIRNSSRPLPDSFINIAFPAVVRCILHTDNNATLENGSECLQAYILIALDQISEWHDDSRCSGLHYVVQVALHLLDPKTSESLAIFVARLIATIVSEGNSRKLNENSIKLLGAVLDKMEQTKMLNVTQSLIMLFAHLVHHQMKAVLDFLYSVTVSTGKSALEYILIEWLPIQHLFFGDYEKKVSTLALCKLLKYYSKTNDQRLADIIYWDQIPENRKATRSKKAQKPRTSIEIPAVIKIYKLLINELSNYMKEAMRQQDKEIENLSDFVDTTDQTAMALSLSQFASATNVPGYNAEAESGDEDPDALSDPLYHVNMQNFLTQFFHSLSQRRCYESFVQHHTQQEKHVLSSIGVAI